MIGIREVRSGIRAAKRRLPTLGGTAHLFLAGVDFDSSVRVYGQLKINRFPGSSITLAKGVVLNADNSRNSLEARGAVIIKTLNRAASLSVGTDTGMTGATVSASGRISIGARVLIGAGVLITDSDHHVVTPPPGTSRRYLGMPQPRSADAVEIEDDVFIGARSIILKGSRIGSGSVIGAGSVVAGVIPGNVIAAGNPCRVLKVLG